MNSQQDPTNKKTDDTKDKKDIKPSQKTETPKSTKTKSTAVPSDNKKNNIPIQNDKAADKDLGLTFSEIYDYHIKVIEDKTNLTINQIYCFFLISFIFFYHWKI